MHAAQPMSQGISKATVVQQANLDKPGSVPAKVILQRSFLDELAGLRGLNAAACTPLAFHGNAGLLQAFIPCEAAV